MKKRLEVGSPYCDESTMFKLCWTRKAVTAWTIPGRSGPERVRMKLEAMLNLSRDGVESVKCAKMSQLRVKEKASSQIKLVV